MSLLKTAGITLLWSLFLTPCGAQESSFPFTWKTGERTAGLPEYVAPPAPNLYNNSPNLRVGWGIDSPTGFVLIDGEVWVMFNSGNQYGTTVKVARYRGADFEHTVREPDGVITVGPGISTHFCGGLWYDAEEKKLYAPIHCEYERAISPPAGWTRKKTRLATSTDRGLTWHMEGDILTDCMPDPGDWQRFSGSYFEAGPADFDFYADARGGYFYIFSCNAYAPKNGTMNNFLWFNEAARCAITDKMAPGKWHKFSGGTWTEPGLGGKSSKVSMASYGIYGRVMYSSTLGKYLRIGVSMGVIDKRFTHLGLTDGSVFVSTCDDLSKEDWTPAGKILDNPANDRFGFTLADSSMKDPFVCKSSLHIYNYWLYNLPSRSIEVTFGPGSTPAAGFPRYGSYAYEPLPESGDTIVGRRTKITGALNPETVYGGSGWVTRNDPAYFQSAARECGQPGASVQFSFKGTGVYWRAVADTDGGKADVYIDGKLAGTVDCWYREALPFQFAFVKTGLAAGVMHTFRAVIRPERNPRSTGTVIRHMAFEYTAESYRASAGFSGVAGKNNWEYRHGEGGASRELEFGGFIKPFESRWTDGDSCSVGPEFQIPGDQPVSRAWRAPHAGKVRLEGTARTDPGGGAGLTAVILCRGREVWSSHTEGSGAPGSHDISVDVEKGDMIEFSARRAGGAMRGRVSWDPVVTYESM